MNSLMISRINASTLLVRIGASIHSRMLAFTAKSIGNLIDGAFLVFELEVEFSQKFLPPCLLRGQLRLAEEVIDNVVRFHHEW